MRSLIMAPLGAAVLALAACGGNGDKPVRDLAIYCQFHDCHCRKPGITLFSSAEKAELLWRQNGDAYCPDGFEIREGKE